MAKLKSKTLVFPLAGQNKAMGYQRQPPFTTIDCQDVFPRDTSSEMARGGSRPGLTNVFRDQLGDGEPIRSLATIRQLGQKAGHFGDDFFGQTPDYLGGPWELMSQNFDYVPRIMPLMPGCVVWYDRYGYPINCGALAPELEEEEIDEEVTYSISILVPPAYQHATYKNWCGPYGKLGIVARSQSRVSPWSIDGVTAYMNCKVNTFHLVYYVAGDLAGSELVAISGPIVKAGFVLQMLICEDKGTPANGTIEARFIPLDGSETVSLELSPEKKSPGTEAGFWIECKEAAPGVAPNYSVIESFQWNYSTDTAERAGTRVVAVSGTDIYNEDGKGGMSKITPSGLAVGGNIQLQAAEFFGKLYIANGTEKVLMVEPYAGTEAEQVTDSPESNTITSYLGRLVTAGGNEVDGNPSGSDPYNFYMSAQTDATNWDTGAGLMTSAVSGNTSGVDTGRFPSAITALAAPSDDYMFIASVDSVAVLRGSPRRGGPMDLLSSKVGFLGPMAYCITPDGRTFFLSRMGLYVLEGPVPPVAVSEQVLPLALKRIDSQANAVCLGYDPYRNGILICVSPWRGGTGINYFYTWDPPGFWPIRFAAEHQPFSMATVSADHLTAAGLILGCRDGYIRRFSGSSATDDGETITSYVLIGPIKLGVGEGDSGLLVHLDAIMAGTSGDVTWSLHMGDSAEEALVADAQETGTWSAGSSNRDSPFARGATCFLKLTGTNRWAMESIRLSIEPYVTSTKL